MSRIITVHGAFTKDGTSELWQRLLKPLLKEKYDWTDFKYGLVGFWNSVSRSRSAGEDLAREANQDDTIIAFSNGGLVVWEALEAGANFNKAILIQPALTKNAEFGPGVDKIFITYNSSDYIVYLSRLWSMPLNYLLDRKNSWGAMGHYGYEGPGDQRIFQIDQQQECGSIGHFGWRKNDLDCWKEKIYQLTKV